MIVRKFLLSLIAALGLAGCYESQIAVYDSGGYFPYKGTYICSIMGMGTKLLQIDEEKSGLVFSSYKYHLVDPKKSKREEVIINKIDGNLYVAQEEDISRGGGKIYNYFFFIAQNDKEFLIAAGSTINRGIRELAERYGLSVKKMMREMTKVYHLSGSQDNLRRFLENHDENMVVPVAACRAER